MHLHICWRIKKYKCAGSKPFKGIMSHVKGGHMRLSNISVTFKTQNCVIYENCKIPILRFYNFTYILILVIISKIIKKKKLASVLSWTARGPSGSRNSLLCIEGAVIMGMVYVCGCWCWWQVKGVSCQVSVDR